MDGIEGLLASNFGVRPQGKAAPMAAAASSSRGGSSSGSAWPNPRSTPASAPSYDDLFGAPVPVPAPASAAASSPSLDSLFDSFKPPAPSSSSAAAARSKPAFDDDDIFSAVPGLRPTNSASSATRYDGDDVFGAGTAGPVYDDVFVSSNPRSAPQHSSYDDLLGGLAGRPRAEERKGSVAVEDDDLLGGFGMMPPPASEKKKPVVAEEDSQGSNGFDDLIPGFASTSPPKSRKIDDDNKKKPAVPTSKSTPNKNFDSTADDESLFDDSSTFDQVPKSDPLFTSEINGTKDSHQNSNSVQSSVNRNPASRSSLEDFGDVMPKSQSTRYSDIHVDDSSERYSGNSMEDQSPISTESEDDIWLTVSEIPLFTRPTSAPPPSRSPPRLKQKSLGAKANGKYDEYVTQSTQSRNHYKDLPKQADISSTSEWGGVAMDKPQMPANYDNNSFDDDEEFNTNSAAREEAESQERLEQAQEMRQREEQRRLEKERELEQQREKQAVERATKEARDRAAAEARAKAERDARQRSQRAAVQRAHQEARERAAAEAKERVARAAAEERERAATEAKERERTVSRDKAAAERAAVERVQQEARKRAERAATERAAAEARERHAAAAAAAAKEKQSTPVDVESFFRDSAPKQRAPTVDSTFDPQPRGRGTVNGSQRAAPTSASTRKANTSSATNMDNLFNLFDDQVPASSNVFQDVEGESEERRRARLERHQRTNERVEKALAEKNERDMQVQREQAERDRIGDSLDFEIKRWAAGKEGNLRALLSTLQYILWPACGWQAVSLTDLITGAAVKKQYRKATLCIHPDKVQQKGATLQQKYIAEKVFDILKEAWNKFNSEELF
ncbi:auxilin-related protein 1 isoform X2 [Brachypodium distachyon]|uniref:auxilin-related protein 1 isoform X2 n=1 Tax=Brachypodium distachyon TaxID=15368 RepID=UPI00071D2C0F|nr:auxilin-related protein 1 isoform X2 [Brachypodium distachyon]|eukprot:XP_014758527.1 auxilin-related protein 1 isoform X2 [Brachypodium distachyon]